MNKSKKMEQMMPMNEEDLALLKDKDGGKVALQRVNVHGRLHGLMAEIEVEQIYLNPQKKNIEAIYTFPLPLGATLLSLEVEIGGRELAGMVVEKKEAERQYEDAVTDGDSAIMLEEVGPGLYTASLGNLMARESAVLRYRYGLLLSWQGDQLRLLLPTTIAPRYGDAEAAGMRPHQVPTSSITAEYPFTIAIEIEGELASSILSSPSHAIGIERTGKGVSVRASDKAFLDRDFVLTLQSDKAQSSCVITPDCENQVALASLRIPALSGNDDEPLALKILIDCSGSMGGTSIIQARKAALEILNQLQPKDTFNVTLFGNEYEHCFNNMVPATAKNITIAWNKLEKLGADMGGTEMEQAIEAVFSLGSESRSQAAVLLITDGEIHEHEKLVKRAEKSSHRVFTVGVGNAVAEVFLKSLSSVTGGACELVAPQEGMTERVLQQFHRMRQPKLGKLILNWPLMPIWQTALPETVFAGDTVNVFAGFTQAISGEVTLAISSGEMITSAVTSVNEPEIPRIAAARRMATASEGAKLQMALEYQLLSPLTNFLVVAERDAKAVDLPELHHVPQMLAAGWGGTGVDTHDLLSFSRKESSDLQFFASVDCRELDIPLVSRTSRHHEATIEAMNKVIGVEPTFILIDEDEDTITASTASSEVTLAIDFIKNLEAKYSGTFRKQKMPATILELLDLGLDTNSSTDLQRFVDIGENETIVVATFLYSLTESDLGDLFSRSFKRAVFKFWKDTVKNAPLFEKIRHSLNILSPVHILDIP
jgi:Ca-activated chloride channel family protein